MNGSIIEQLHYLCLLTEGRLFRPMILSEKFPLTGALVATTLLTYLVPQNSALIVTGISLSSIPPVNDASLTAGDWRSEYFDASGTAQMWIDVNGSPKTPKNASYFALLNRPLLLLFNGGETVKLMVQRHTGDVPPTENVLIAMEGYLAPAAALQKLSFNETQVIANYA